MSFQQWRKNFIRSIDQVINKVLNRPAQTGTEHQVSTRTTTYPSTALDPAPPLFTSDHVPSILMDRPLEPYRRNLKTINIVPDDVLLKIFDFYVIEDFRLPGKERVEWTTLAHVCQRWRCVVFQSPRSLNLQLLCGPRTPVKDILDIWPPLPLKIHAYGLPDSWDRTSSVDNIIAALGHDDRVCQIILGRLTNSPFRHITYSAVMQKPFPKLTHLLLGMLVCDRPGPTLPNSFLGGNAPRLQSLELANIPFPGLQKLLLSSTHLVHLDLYNIPRSGYIPPEAMATSLSALTDLEFLRLRFQYPRPRPALEHRRPPPLTRPILPSLTTVVFKGASEYLEEILSRIDAPRINKMHIAFFNQLIFDTPQLFQFITRVPTRRAPEKGRIIFNPEAVTVKFPSQTSDYGVLSARILCRVPEWQLSSLEQLCASSLPPVSTLEDLSIFSNGQYPPHWQVDIENTLWLDLLRPFVAVKNLYLSKEFVHHIVLALQELVGGRTTEVLPILENIFLEGFRPASLHQGIEKFVAARQLTGHLVNINVSPESDVCWEYTD